MFVKIATYESNNCTFILLSRGLIESLGWEADDKVLILSYPQSLTLVRDEVGKPLKRVGNQLRVISTALFRPHSSTRYESVRIVDGKLYIELDGVLDGDLFEEAPIVADLPEPYEEALDIVTTRSKESMHILVQRYHEAEELREKEEKLIQTQQEEAEKAVASLGDGVLTEDSTSYPLELLLAGKIIGKDEKGRNIRELRHDDAVSLLGMLTSSMYREKEKGLRVKGLIGSLPDNANDLCLTPNDIWKGPLEVLGLDEYSIDVANPCEDFGSMNGKHTRLGVPMEVEFSGVAAKIKWGLERGTVGSIAKTWKGRAVWCNPPFSQKNWATFAEKAALEAALGHLVGGRREIHADYVFVLLPGFIGTRGSKQDEHLYIPGATFEIELQEEPVFWMIDNWKANLATGFEDKKAFIKGLGGSVRIIIYSRDSDRCRVATDLITYYEKLNYLLPRKADYYRWLAGRTLNDDLMTRDEFRREAMERGSWKEPPSGMAILGDVENKLK